MDSKAGVRWGSGREVQEGRDVYSRLIQVVAWQKPIQYCKAVILQLEINF